MHQYDARVAASFFHQHPDSEDLLKEAGADLQLYFRSRRRYDELIPLLGSEYVLYLRLRDLIGGDQTQALLQAATSYVWEAHDQDRTSTLAAMLGTAEDLDIAATRFWSLLQRNRPLLWQDESTLLRDRVSALMTFTAEYVEGVIKRELWPVLACRDIVRGTSKDPLRWQCEKLGNMVSAASALPDPLGSFLGANPLPDVALNHLRNAGAHRDYQVTRDKIVLFPRTHAVDVTMAELEEALDRIGTTRMFLKLFDTIATLQDVEGLTEAGYEPSQAPETVAINLVSKLGPHGIHVDSVRRTGEHTEVLCSTDRDYSDEDLFFAVLQNIAEMVAVYSDTFATTEESMLNVRIRNKQGSVLRASCPVRRGLTALNTPGRSEIVFSILRDGIAGTARLKIDIGDDTHPL